jgi:hypothetical protein
VDSVRDTFHRHRLMLPRCGAPQELQQAMALAPSNSARMHRQQTQFSLPTIGELNKPPYYSDQDECPAIAGDLDEKKPRMADATLGGDLQVNSQIVDAM